MPQLPSRDGEGRVLRKVQRFKCQQCGKRFSPPQEKPFDADVRLPREKVVMILHCLVEGNSVRSTARLCDVEKRTVLKLLKLAGENCERMLVERIHEVPVKDLQLDEIWTFVKKKGRPQMAVGIGREQDRRRLHVHCTRAHEQTSGGVASWQTGSGQQVNTEDFISKVRWATANTRFEVCTDGFEPYVNAIDTGLHDRVDYSQIIKVYSTQEEGRERYSPENSSPSRRKR